MREAYVLEYQPYPTVHREMSTGLREECLWSTRNGAGPLLPRWCREHYPQSGGAKMVLDLITKTSTVATDTSRADIEEVTIFFRNDGANRGLKARRFVNQSWPPASAILRSPKMGVTYLYVGLLERFLVISTCFARSGSAITINRPRTGTVKLKTVPYVFDHSRSLISIKTFPYVFDHSRSLISICLPSPGLGRSRALSQKNRSGGLGGYESFGFLFASCW
jgi:hypothetical protein